MARGSKKKKVRDKKVEKEGPIVPFDPTDRVLVNNIHSQEEY